MSTEISWTDETWNVSVGCERCSPGCDNCYAIRVAARGMQEAHRGLTFTDPGGPFGPRQPPDWTGEVRLLPDRLDIPLHWRKPRRVFVDSMSDLFHPDIPSAYIGRVFATMRDAPQHTFQVLTKRPQRMAKLLGGPGGFEIVLPNVWLGTSVENQRYADMRIPHVLATPAAVRFLSVEPLLGPVDLYPWLMQPWPKGGIDWVIVGGESGRGARPMETEWAERIVNDCKAAGVAVFVKQLGTVRGGKQHHDIDTFPESLRVREFPS